MAAKELGLAIECIGDPEGVYRLVEVQLLRQGGAYRVCAVEEWGCVQPTGMRRTHGWGRTVAEAAAGALWNAPARMDGELLRRVIDKAIELAAAEPEDWENRRRLGA